MLRIESVVEGHGDVDAVPVLLRRCAQTWNPAVPFATSRPIRVPRTRLVKPGELERGVRLASLKARGGGVLVLIDADDDCPAETGPALLERARTVTDRVAVVLARREFESWFLASAPSIAGRRGLRDGLTSPERSEEIRDAKGWLTRAMVDPLRAPYSETLDQPALAAVFDLQSALEGSPSFGKLYRDVRRLLERLHQG